MPCGTCNGLGAIDDVNGAVMMCPTCSGQQMAPQKPGASAAPMCPRCAEPLATLPTKCADPACPHWLAAQHYAGKVGIGPYGRQIPELERLLRLALAHSERFGDVTAEEMSWRADVRSVLGL
jgi:hypothetical protein